ncbi:hypothetical protein M413DRAFT_31172 [Hebeloma cylindrosporum]|uniref:Nephrocystin 3-like N-terminal domain-containing protein n=1 Tax=Hebeloma cylindrosporum TaxID=76867 RepID=A0A0C3BZX8_HEBCY|nr:hypothetical protein M413DRAFT_31172 [Hebeloma cylindrosporum h7]
MHKLGSDPTNLSTSGMSLFANARNTSISGGSFVTVSMGGVNVQQHPTTLQRGLDLLNEHIASGAIHDSAERYDPPKCLPRTREAILRKIMDWVERCPENKGLFLWLYGPAGAGKSAIAQTIAERCEELGLLAASFFFSRTAAGRNDISRLVSTIVYSLIRTIPEIRDHVLTLLGNDPQILSRAASSQMRMLVIDPLNMVSPAILAHRPRFIIIDGLDECGNSDSQREILKFLASANDRLNAQLLFLIASRPEPIIRLTLNSDIFNSTMFTIALDDSYQTDLDLHQYLQTHFQEIKAMHPMRQHIPTSWPSHEDINTLIYKANGQFIYAATVVRYVQSPRHRPEDQLASILALRSDKDAPFSGVDSLYLQILSSVNKEVLDKVLEILACLVFIRGDGHDYIKGSARMLEDFLCYKRGDLDILMSNFHSLIYFPPSEKLRRPIRVHHASFCDFLVDRGRSHEFFLDAQTREATLVYRWILYMEKFHEQQKWSLAKMAQWMDMEFRHISHSACTPQLTDVLSYFNFFDILKGNDQWKQSLRYVPGFIYWLYENRSSGGLSLKAFTCQLQHFDEYILHALCSLSLPLQKCLPAAISLPSFYGQGDNAFQMILIIDSLTSLDISPLFYGQADPPKRDTTFLKMLQFINEFFRDSSRSGSFCVTESSYSNLALYCAKVVFDPAW